MLRICVLLLFIPLRAHSKRRSELFDLDADDVVASEIGDIYEARSKLNKIFQDSEPNIFSTNIRTTDKNSTAKILNRNITEPNEIGTTEIHMAATVSPEIQASLINLTLNDLKLRQMKRQIELVLNRDFNLIPDFKNKGDDPDVQTRRFEKIVEKHKDVLEGQETRREIYDPDDNVERAWEQKLRTIRLMEHFVYITRYKMIYSQLLRNKYWKNHRYQLGYLFALLRQVKNMQKWIWFTVHHWRTRIGTIYFHLKMYEKIIKLDIDLRDIMKKIRRTEYDKNLWYNPKFYDYSLERPRT